MIKTMLEPAVIAESAVVSSGPKNLLRFAPYVVALFFASWGLRGVTCNNVVDSDAARHAMNGALVHDWLLSGKLGTPIEYARYYYSRLPALSMPYHPPLFPALESLFFFGFGVNVLAARLAVALATGLSAVLLYRLVMATHSSHALAIASTVTFLSWGWSQFLANDVMLEFPTMVFTLGALHYLRDLERGYSLSHGLKYAVLAAAAVWSKQQAVFLGVVPFVFVVFARRWRLLFDKAIWISFMVFGGLVYLLTRLSVPFQNTGVNQVSTTNWLPAIFGHNWRFYVRVLRAELGTGPAILVAVAFVAFLLLPRRGRRDLAANDLYLAWALPAIGLLLVIGPFAERYLFLAFPALLVIGYAALLRISGWLLPPQRAWYAPAAVAAAYFLFHLNTPITFMRGPSEAARKVVSAAPGRVLYCGQTDGSFIFAVRSLDPDLRTVVIRGDKLSRSTFDPVQFEDFAHRYGIRHIVLESTPAGSPWDRLRASPSPSMVLEQEIPLACSQRRWNGDLRVYRFTNPSPNPDNTLKLPIPVIGSDLEARF
jgi:4-amino-4-deoxy-L-arabinose transferase-like glycosyltransferase